jgi:hypothetical protein
MSNKPMPWIKQYPTRLHDVRLASLNDRQKLRYYEMYMLAGQLNAEGAFIQEGKQLAPSEIAYLLRVNDPKQFEKDLNALKKARLIRANGHGPYIADFKDEQLNWLEVQRGNRERQERFKQSHKDNALVTDGSHVGNAPRTRTRIQNQIKKENQTTHPNPPSANSKGDSPLGGGVGSKQKGTYLDGPEFKTVSKKLRSELAHIEKVLSLSGLGNLRLKNTLTLLAMRSFPKNNRTQFVVAALASAYSDKSVNNKAIVTAHRIEKDRVPSEYLSPSTWDVIPENILKAAGNAIDVIEPRSKGDRIREKVKAIRSRGRE